MTEYAKLKVDELQSLLKERSIANTGKKADLIKRLEDDDASKKSTTKSGGAEDEIDWDDDANSAPTKAVAADITAADATTQPAAAAIAAGGTAQPPNPRAVPNQVPAENVTTSTDLKVESPGPSSGIATESTPKAEDKSTVPLATLQDEIEKRKARHAKFGTDANADERLKALERQAKFGGTSTSATSNTASDEKMIRGLNSSLDDREAERKNGTKRVRTVTSNGSAPAPENKKQKVVGQDSAGLPKTNDAGSRTATGSWMSEDDKVKAAARKARFGAAAAA